MQKTQLLRYQRIPKVVQDRVTLLSSIKALAHVEEDETAYDKEIELLMQTAVTRMKMAGVKYAILGEDTSGNVVTVGNFKVGSVKVGELIVKRDYNTTALEYIATIVKLGLYQDGTGAYYNTLSDIADELLTTMYYAASTDLYDNEE